MKSEGLSLLVLTELFLPTKGGTTIWFSEVYRRLGGKTIHIVTADVPGATEVDAVHPNSVHRVDLRRRPWLRPESLAMYLKLLGKSLALALTHRFSAVHAIRALPEGLVAWLVARLIFRPVVVYAHGEELTTWGNGGKYKAMRFTLRHADTVVANSDYTRDELIHMGIDAERIVLIYPGVNIERFHPDLPCEDLKAVIGLAPGQKLILSVGRLQRRKGFDMVVRSLPELLKQGLDIRYALIGIGEDRDYLFELAKELGVADRIHLLGHVSEDDLPRWYNACDVFAMPNREVNGDTEGFGMVFLEAAACGKPVIAGKAGGTGAAVLDQVTGLQIDGSHVDELVSGLRDILSNNDLRHSLGKAGYERAHREFNWEYIADKTFRIAK